MSNSLQHHSMKLRYIDKGYSDLKSALKSLSDQSLKTSRRLDDTYYSILEKVSVLRQTIGSLQELSGLTKELRENFESDTKELVEDVQGQYDGFDNFENQEHQIVVLEDRIQTSKKKADSLTDRLSKAKERVDARAQAELEWAAKNSRKSILIGVYYMYADMLLGRTRIFWSILGSIVALIFAAVLFHHLRPVYVTHDTQPTLDFASRAAIMDAPIPNIAKEAIIGYTPKSEVKPVPRNTAGAVDDDARLQDLFKEL
jgi:hypothetical protein